MTNQYDEITRGYFELYNFENFQYKPLCMTEKKYSTEYEMPEDLDLLILVYDRNFGRAELHPNGIGGLYHHQGDTWTKNHVIIFCDCPNFKYSEPVWLLTHELSHFVLFYKGFNKSIVEDLIHELDALHDFCLEEVSHPTEKCLSVTTKLNLSSYQWTVMKPFQPAIVQSPFFDFKQTSDSELNSNYELRKIITKWWASGKISSEYFLNIMELLTVEKRLLEEQALQAYQSETKTFTDPPKDQKKDWENYNKELGLTDKKLENILKLVPFINSQN